MQNEGNFYPMPATCRWQWGNICMGAALLHPQEWVQREGHPTIKLNQMTMQTTDLATLSETHWSLPSHSLPGNATCLLVLFWFWSCISLEKLVVQWYKKKDSPQLAALVKWCKSIFHQNKLYLPKQTPVEWGRKKKQTNPALHRIT